MLRITDENRQQVLEILSSTVLCIDILLQQADIAAKLNYLSIKHSIEITSKQDLIKFVSEILVKDQYFEFREEILLSLFEEHTLIYAQAHAKVKLLPLEVRAMIPDLVAAMHYCDDKFISELFGLVANEPENVQKSTFNLLRFLTVAEEPTTRNENNKQANNTSNGYGYGGNGYGYGGNGYGYGGNGYGYGGYGYGGYGYGGYGYGGYGYGGYGYGGYGYGGYGYGGYGYGGYGYGYGYDGYGYGYGYYGSYYENAYYGGDYSYLWSGIEFGNETPAQLEQINKRLRLNQLFTRGVKNNEGLVWKFKDISQRFTVAESDVIIAEAEASPGTDLEMKLFRGAAHAAMRNPEVLNKLTRNKK